MIDDHGQHNDQPGDRGTEVAARLAAEECYESLFRRIPAIAHSLNARGLSAAVSDECDE